MCLRLTIMTDNVWNNSELNAQTPRSNGEDLGEGHASGPLFVCPSDPTSAGSRTGDIRVRLRLSRSKLTTWRIERLPGVHGAWRRLDSFVWHNRCHLNPPHALHGLILVLKKSEENEWDSPGTVVACRCSGSTHTHTGQTHSWVGSFKGVSLRTYVFVISSLEMLNILKATIWNIPKSSTAIVIAYAY